MAEVGHANNIPFILHPRTPGVHLTTLCSELLSWLCTFTNRSELCHHAMLLDNYRIAAAGVTSPSTQGNCGVGNQTQYLSSFNILHSFLLLLVERSRDQVRYVIMRHYSWVYNSYSSLINFGPYGSAINTLVRDFGRKSCTRPYPGGRDFTPYSFQLEWNTLPLFLG